MFDCNFIDGVCNGGRAKQRRSGGVPCCDNCAHNTGFFKEKLDELPDNIQERFDSVTGFLREAGCILASTERSQTCQNYYCRHAKK